jgi:hypothetical protein
MSRKPKMVVEKVEGIDMRTYRGVEDPRHVAGRTSRSVSEAFKDATYACAIERHRGDWYEAVRWFQDFFMTLFLGGLCHSLPDPSSFMANEVGTKRIESDMSFFN